MEAIELTEASEAERGEGDVLFSREGFSEFGRAGRSGRISRG